MAALKYSRQREAIINFLKTRYDHPTADVVYSNVRNEFPNISLGTVYRNLNMLSEDGTIQKISVGGADHFDGNAKNHYHMLCKECKRLYDVAYPVLEDIEKKAQQTGKKAASTSDPEPNAEEMDGDEMLPAAVDVILETGQASVSMLQRRLKLGYARAARIVDEMEQQGIVGPYAGSKPRTILITKEQWEAMQNSGPTQMGFDDLDESDSG